MTTLYETNPLKDARWERFLQHHSKAFVFHTPPWLEALHRTYGYEMKVLTSSPPTSELTNGVVFCRVRSWLTGNRLISLPFSDHCDLLLDNASDYPDYINWFKDECDNLRYKYVELRPQSTTHDVFADMYHTRSYSLHQLDLSGSLEEIFHRLHKDSLQRRIRRADKEHLSYQRGRSATLFSHFYQLLTLTRRRHNLPPPPRQWFTHLLQCMRNSLEIRVALKNDVPIAAILTLRYRTTVVYKYGGSDDRYHSVGAMPFLFWQLIQESKTSGVDMIDFGRSDLDNSGLVRFKDHFGATKSILSYYRYPQSVIHEPWGSRKVGHLVRLLPESLVSTAGKVLYKHMA